MNGRAIRPTLLGVAVALLLAGAARAEDDSLASPRATLRTFLGALNDVKKRSAPEERADGAVACIDFGSLGGALGEDRKRRRAWQMLDLLDRTRGVIDLETVPDTPDGPPYVVFDHEEGRVEIAREASGEWRFTAASLDALPALLLAHRDVELKDGLSGAEPVLGPTLDYVSLIPDSLRGTAFLLAHWQWIGLFVLVILGIAGDRLLVFVLGLVVRARLRREQIRVDRKLRKNALRPLGLLALALIWWIGLEPLDLPDRVHVVLMIVAKGLAALASVWSAYRLVDLVTDYLQRKAAGTESRIDDVLVPLVRKSIKVFIAAFGLVFVADNLDVDITSLLAGLGLGGLAFALAARETVANLFGSVTVLLDRPFDIGDWVRIGDVDGNVESIGFRSTRVRTFYNSQITVPNSQMITAVVDNFGARRYRRIKTMLSLTYDTPPDRIESFCEGIRELIRRHPYTRKDYYHVYLNAFAASSLDVLLYCFVETPDWATELREKHRLFADILRLADRLGVSFAFPTQTLHIEREAPEPSPEADGDAVKEAARQGRRQASEIVAAHLPGGRKPPPVVLGAQSLDPELDGRNVGGDEG